jgi:CRISPR/Cas system-associated exonuclease Cas4 (RecB family)
MQARRVVMTRSRQIQGQIEGKLTGWKSTPMPLQYAEKINAARSGIARAAAATARDVWLHLVAVRAEG